MSNESGGGNFLVGLLIGAAVGAMGALLLAPKARKEIQDTLTAEGKKLRETAEGKLAELRDRKDDLYERSREAFAETKEGVKKAAQSFTKS